MSAVFFSSFCRALISARLSRNAVACRVILGPTRFHPQAVLLVACRRRCNAWTLAASDCAHASAARWSLARVASSCHLHVLSTAACEPRRRLAGRARGPAAPPQVCLASWGGPHHRGPGVQPRRWISPMPDHCPPRLVLEIRAAAAEVELLRNEVTACSGDGWSCGGFPAARHPPREPAHAVVGGGSLLPSAPPRAVARSVPLVYV